MQVSKDTIVNAGAKISAIIPTWNRADLLRSILTNLRGQTQPPDQIIVVDNGSTDKTKLVTEEFNVELVELSRNYGFAVAVNEGLKWIRGEWVLIVNNDVQLQADWISRILTAVREANAFF